MLVQIEAIQFAFFRYPQRAGCISGIHDRHGDGEGGKRNVETYGTYTPQANGGRYLGPRSVIDALNGLDASGVVERQDSVSDAVHDRLDSCLSLFRRRATLDGLDVQPRGLERDSRIVS